MLTTGATESTSRIKMPLTAKPEVEYIRNHLTELANIDFLFDLGPQYNV